MSKPAGASRLTYKDPDYVGLTSWVALAADAEVDQWSRRTPPGFLGTPGSGEASLVHRAGRLSAASAVFEAGQLIGMKPCLSEDSHPWLLNDGRALDAIRLPEEECVFADQHK